MSSRGIIFLVGTTVIVSAVGFFTIDFLRKRKGETLREIASNPQALVTASSAAVLPSMYPTQDGFSNYTRSPWVLEAYYSTVQTLPNGMTATAAAIDGIGIGA